MKIGILADIHGHQKHLKRAIDLLDRRQVDAFIALGDLIAHTSQAAETVAMLQDVGTAATSLVIMNWACALIHTRNCYNNWSRP